MNPSQRNTDAGASGKDAEAARLMNSGKKDDPPTGSSFQSSRPSAPLLPSSLYNPEMTTLEPPSYESVVAQDTSDLQNRFGSSSTGNLHQTCNQAPHPTASGSAPQSPYPPRVGFSPYGTPAQAPYPTDTRTGSRVPDNLPYPRGPGLHSVVTHQPPYPADSGYPTRPTSKAPYPPVPMPMPRHDPVDTHTEIGFVAPVTTEPEPSALGFRPEVFNGVTAPNHVNLDQERQEELAYAVRLEAEKRRKIKAAIVVLGLGIAFIAIFALIKHLKAIHS